MHVDIVVTGIIQGVGFRPFVYRTALQHNLSGFVRNRGDAGVEISIEGEERHVKRFISELREKKPPLAQIYDMDVNYSADRRLSKGFRILKSFESGNRSGSIIPPDVSICDQCLRELRSRGDRRRDYFFITCTDCGPRYTTIEQLPYDRPNTTMQDFPMCKQCRSEYSDPSNRRFHAQTVACERCGPKVFLTASNGELLKSKDPVREAGRLLGEGKIVAVKGNGGFHLAASTVQSDVVMRLRRTKERSQKPFAVMARSLDAVRSFAEVSEAEEELLTSYIKPILLLRKGENCFLSDQIAPGLHNMGVMLPYTGLHVMLFDDVGETAFIMTSANPPSEPIIIENEEALRRLRGVVDYFLLHNRKIAQRCDDSVVRMVGGVQSIVRRSRGYAPTPIHLHGSADRCTLGLGAEENVNSCVLLRDKAFISQYIGDIERLETYQYLQDATDHLLSLTKAKVEAVACDLHPKFATSRLARDLAARLGCEVVQVQHHHAHVSSLMGEHNVEQIVGVACDGFGYGADRKAWGGEILYCNPEGYQRVSHLQEQPLVGGDLATRYPIRMAAGILHNSDGVEEWLLSKARYLPHGSKEAEIILQQVRRKPPLETTSLGRVLDAVAAVLDICYERTYEGEPAMKVESAAVTGRDILRLKPQVEGGVLKTANLLEALFKQRKKHSTADLAKSAQAYLARGLAQLASEAAENLGVKAVGFSGGVAYNEYIASTLRRLMEAEKLKFFTHSQVPPGDGGISFGQSVVAGFKG
jgi:hydrogenase maturation protein HypF